MAESNVDQFSSEIIRPGFRVSVTRISNSVGDEFSIISEFERFDSISAPVNYLRKV